MHMSYLHLLFGQLVENTVEILDELAAWPERVLRQKSSV